MATYFYDPAAETLGAPTGWSYDGPTAGSISDLEVITKDSTQVLRVSPVGDTNANRMFYYDSSGSVLDSETVALWSRDVAIDDDVASPIVRGVSPSDDTFAQQAYVAQHLNATTLRIIRLPFSNLGSVTSNTTTEVIYATRIRRDWQVATTDNRIRTKTWVASETEPESWDQDITNDFHAGNGKLGLTQFSASGVTFFHGIGFATDGDTAPTATVGTAHTRTIRSTTVGTLS